MNRYIERNGENIAFVPTVNLKFIEKDGKRILHQLYVEDINNIPMKPKQRVWLEV
jgi:hypothetical protein